MFKTFLSRNWLMRLSQLEFGISINLDKYYDKMSEYILGLQQRSVESQERLKGMQLNEQMIYQNLSEYPDIRNLEHAIATNDFVQLEQMLWSIRQYASSIGYGAENREKRDKAYNAFLHLRDYLDSKDPYTFTEEDAKSQIQELLSQTKNNMNKISAEIHNAISLIELWNNSPIFIEVVQPYDENGKVNWLLAGEDAIITVGKETEEAMAPSFEVFMIEGKLTIPSEGIIEDDDFFRNSEYTRDYFNLIRELQHPGSSSRRGKILTLYTSRPRKDRELYMNAEMVPGGIWLSSNADNAVNEGYEAGGLRDLWKVRIDERYVTKKLDVPSYKHYEVMGRDRIKVELLVFLGEIE